MNKPKSLTALYDAQCEGDRYTAVLRRSRKWPANPGKNMCLGFNENPTHPASGISIFSECDNGPHLGKRIKFEALPEHLQKHIVSRIED